MKIILLLTFISLSAYATNCSIYESKRFGNKFGAQKLSFNLLEAKFGPISDDVKIGEFDLTDDIRIRVESSIMQVSEDERALITSRLYVLRHRGGNGYEVIHESLPSYNNTYEDKVVFNLNKMFGDHSESVDYQLSEGINLKNSILECFIL